jgi:D-xylose reductase
MSTFTLNNGLKMPIVGHGLWKIPKPVTADHVYDAIKAGYRLFDGACGESVFH